MDAVANPHLPLERGLALLPEVVESAADVHGGLIARADNDVRADRGDRVREVADDADDLGRGCAGRELGQVAGVAERQRVEAVRFPTEAVRVDRAGGIVARASGIPEMALAIGGQDCRVGGSAVLFDQRHGRGDCLGESVTASAQLDRLRGLPQAVVEVGGQVGPVGLADHVRIAEIRERGLDVSVDQDGGIFLSILDQLAGVENGRADLLDVDVHLGQLCASGNGGATFGDERGGRPASVDRVLLALAGDAVDLREIQRRALAIDGVDQGLAVAVSDEVAARGVGALKKGDRVGHEITSFVRIGCGSGAAGPERW